MNTAIIAIIGLIIVLGIIIVMMRGKRGADQQTPPATQPITQQPNTPVPQPTTKPQETAPASTATSVTTAAGSEAMASMSEPLATDDSPAMTENTPSFDDLESELVLGDEDQVNIPTKETPTDSLSLDDDALNFADFEESLDDNSEQSTSQPAQPANDELTLDDSFDAGLSLDDSTTANPVNDLDAGLNDTLEDNVLDLSDSFADTESSEPARELNSDTFDNVDGSEFDLNDMTLEDDTADTIAPVNDSDDLDKELMVSDDTQEFSFEDPTSDASSDTPSALETDDSTALESTSLDIQPQIQEVILEDAGELDMSDLELSSEDDSDTQNDIQASDDTFAQLDAITQSEIDNGAQSDQDEFLTEFEPTQKLATTSESGDTPEHDDLSTQAVETIDETSDSEITADDSAELTPDISSAPVVDDAKFMQAFDFVQDLDGTQVTLDLAQQYLELGEYDSAKRLVNEVLSGQGSDSQKTAAQNMLDNMS